MEYEEYVDINKKDLNGVTFEQIHDLIKNPKEKAAYEKQYEKLFKTQPEKRVQLYKQNVQSFIDSVSAIASNSAAKALKAAPGDFAAEKAAAKGKERAPELEDLPTTVKDVPEEDKARAKEAGMDPLKLFSCK